MRLLTPATLMFISLIAFFSSLLHAGGKNRFECSCAVEPMDGWMIAWSELFGGWIGGSVDVVCECLAPINCFWHTVESRHEVEFARAGDLCQPTWGELDDESCSEGLVAGESRFSLTLILSKNFTATSSFPLVSRPSSTQHSTTNLSSTGNVHTFHFAAH